MEPKLKQREQRLSRDLRACTGPSGFVFTPFSPSFFLFFVYFFFVLFIAIISPRRNIEWRKASSSLFYLSASLYLPHFISLFPSLSFPTYCLPLSLALSWILNLAESRGLKREIFSNVTREFLDRLIIRLQTMTVPPVPERPKPLERPVIIDLSFNFPEKPSWCTSVDSLRTLRLTYLGSLPRDRDYQTLVSTLS